MACIIDVSDSNTLGPGGRAAVLAAVQVGYEQAWPAMAPPPPDLILEICYDHTLCMTRLRLTLASGSHGVEAALSDEARVDHDPLVLAALGRHLGERAALLLNAPGSAPIQAGPAALHEPISSAADPPRERAVVDHWTDLLAARAQRVANVDRAKAP